MCVWRGEKKKVPLKKKKGGEGEDHSRRASSKEAMQGRKIIKRKEDTVETRECNKN